MPRYHFHLRDGTYTVSDGEGCILFDHAAAIAEAKRFAREMAAIDLRESGIVQLDRRIEIADPSGTVLESVDFVEAIKIVPSR